MRSRQAPRFIIPESETGTFEASQNPVADGAGGVIESLLFSLHAALGALVIGRVLLRPLARAQPAGASSAMTAETGSTAQ